MCKRQCFFMLFGLGSLVGAIYVFVYLTTYPSLLNGGVIKFGPLKLGGDTPIGPGSYTFAPPPTIPKSRFYISVVQDHLWCSFEECSPEGTRIRQLGGWLQGENRASQPQIRWDFGLWSRDGVTSIIVVANRKAKIVGIYPNKNIDDLAEILNIHGNIIEE